jgi:hypothetical protein
LMGPSDSVPDDGLGMSAGATDARRASTFRSP